MSLERDELVDFLGGRQAGHFVGAGEEELGALAIGSAGAVGRAFSSERASQRRRFRLDDRRRSDRAPSQNLRRKSAAVRASGVNAHWVIIAQGAGLLERGTAALATGRKVEWALDAHDLLVERADRRNEQGGVGS